MTPDYIPPEVALPLAAILWGVWLWQGRTRKHPRPPQDRGEG